MGIQVMGIQIMGIQITGIKKVEIPNFESTKNYHRWNTNMNNN